MHNGLGALADLERMEFTEFTELKSMVGSILFIMDAVMEMDPGMVWLIGRVVLLQVLQSFSNQSGSYIVSPILV